MVEQNQKVMGDGRPLRAYWSKRERDLMLDFPRKCDGGMLNTALEPLMKELDKRGYDVTTLRFLVKQKKPAEPKDGE